MNFHRPYQVFGRQLLSVLLLAFAVASGYGQCEVTPKLREVPRGTTFLSCDRIGSTLLAGLPIGVSSCYRVDGATGDLIPGTLHPDLANRLDAGGGRPYATDFCDRELQICVRETLLTGNTGGCSDVVLVRRTFTVRSLNDPFLSVDMESYELRFDRPSLTTLSIAASTVITDCPSDGISAVNPPPAPEDYPFGPGPVHLVPGSCGYDISYTDGPRNNDGCGGGYRMVRTFTVTDNCAGGAERSFVQAVRVGDWTAPTLTPPDSSALLISTNAGCSAVFDPLLTGFSATDLCGPANVTARIYPDGNLQNTPFGPYIVTPDSTVLTDSLPTGDYLIRYTARDSCGNTTFLARPLEITDAAPPVAVCRTTFRIQLGSDGRDQLTVDSLDAGSFDACSPVQRAIVYLDGNGQPVGSPDQRIELDCDLVGPTRFLLLLTDGAGNESSCETVVVIVDNVAPDCMAPADLTVDCRDFNDRFPADLIQQFRSDPVAYGPTINAVFGQPTTSDNCSGTTTSQFLAGGLNDCGVGQLVRIFSVRDVGGSLQSGACVQTINVTAYHDYRLRVPGNQARVCSPDLSPETLSTGNGGCDLFALNTVTDTLPATGIGCYLLRQQVELINWCEYDGEGELIPLPVGSEPRDFLVDPGQEATLTDDRLLRADDRSVVVPDYGSRAGRGGFRYTLETEITDREAPTLELVSPEPGLVFTADCRAAIIVDFSATDNCSVTDIRIFLDRDAADRNGDGSISTADFSSDQRVANDRITDRGAGNFSVNVNNLTVGLHLARFEITDGCGNRTDTILYFPVEDGYSPTPGCLSTVGVSLQPDLDMGGRAFIHTEDLILTPATTCSGGAVEYAIYSEAEAAAPGFLPVPGRDELALDCGNLGDNPVRIYAFAEGGAGSGFCVTVVTVDAIEASICSGRLGSITGRVLTTQGEPMGGMEVANNGESLNFTRTDGAGEFSFAPLEEFVDYTVQPFHDQFPANGVSTRDILLINSYLLNVNRDLGPYQLIAADVNRNRSVTVRDLIEIRRVILRLSPDFTGNTSWRFMPAEYEFPDPEDPWAERFPEVRNFNQLFGNNFADFIAIKTGDVSGNAIPTGGNRTFASEITGRAGDVVNFELRPTDIPGRYAVFHDADALSGFQLTLLSGGHAGAISLEGAVVGAEFIRSTQTGDHHISYAPMNGAPAGNDLPLFYLTGVANPAALELGRGGAGTALSAEAYLADYRAVALRFTVSSPEVDVPTGTLSLYPNPFTNRATISFVWPIREAVELDVFDVAGRRIHTRQLAATGAGVTQSVPLRATELGSATGVITVRLTGIVSGQEMLVRGVAR